MNRGGDSRGDDSFEPFGPELGHSGESDRARSESAPEADAAPPTTEEPDERPVESDEFDPTLAAFCDEPWPPTKANSGEPIPLCIDPHDECEGAPLPYQCYELLGDGVCSNAERWMDPLHCVDGQWECPPGSTTGWECEDDECGSTCQCWGPLAEGQECGASEGLGGATGTD